MTENILEGIKSLIEDLRYEPFHLFMNNSEFKIFNVKNDKILLIRGIRPNKDKKNFTGLCEELCYIAIQRIYKRYPLFWIEIWQGSTDKHFKKSNNHWFIVLKNLVEYGKDLIVDPSFKVVAFKENLSYHFENKVYDSNEYEKKLFLVEDFLFDFHNRKLPIFYDSTTDTVFFLVYNGENGFLLVDENDIALTKDKVMRLTNNKDFYDFYDSLNFFQIEEVNECPQIIREEISLI